MNETTFQQLAVRATGYDSFDALCLAYLQSPDREEFARQRGISERTLRHWCNERFERRYVRRDPDLVR